MNIKELLSTVHNPNAKIKVLKQHLSTEELTSYGTTELKQVLYCIANDLTEVPKALCGNTLKYKSGAYLGVCEKYVSTDSSSCPECHAERTRVSEEKKKKTSLEKYGTEHANQNAEVKTKIRQNNDYEKAKDTRKSTMMEQYGVSSVMQVQEFKDRQVQSCTLNRTAIEMSRHQHRMRSKLIMVQDRIPEYISILHLAPNNTEFSTFLCTKCDTEFEAKTYNKCTSIRCKNCNPYYSHTSQGEKEVLEFVKSICSTEVLQNTRSVIAPYELDIYITEKKLAIEYCGAYYHSVRFRDPDYHQMKQQACEALGIKLLTIFDYEWNDNAQGFMNKIRNEFRSTKALYARKGTVREIGSTEYSEFCTAWHLQGPANASVKLGLFISDELVSVMSFSTPRFTKQYQYELIRFCSSTSVHGAASKLLKYFIRTYNPGSIITYANLRWSTGALYERIGFEYLSSTEPSYVYHKSACAVLSRWQCMKGKISSPGDTRTEQEIMESDGYYRVYDCGNKVYVLRF